jgi:hypothetical protein
MNAAKKKKWLMKVMYSEVKGLTIATLFVS